MLICTNREPESIAQCAGKQRSLRRPGTDGRLFWTERLGTVKIWQDGAAHTFARVQTVTTEPDGSYSERGLLGLAISPTFNKDRFVYAFFSDVNYTEEHIMRWRDCRGTGMDPTLLVTLPSGPDCYGYSHPLAKASCPAGQSPPNYSTESNTLVPTGAAFIDASGPSQFAGHLVFCTLNAGMRIVTPGSPHASLLLVASWT